MRSGRHTSRILLGISVLMLTAGTARAQLPGIFAAQSQIPGLRTSSVSPFDAPVRVAAESPIDVTHISVDLIPIDARGALDVTLFVDLTVVTDTLRRLALPARELVVRGVEVVSPTPPDTSGAEPGPVRLDFVAVDDSLIVFFDAEPRGQTMTIRIAYEAPEGAVMRSTLGDDNACCSWTNGFRSGGVSWLPFAVDPPDRFTAEIRVRPRGNLIPITGGRRDRTRPAFRFDRPVRADQLAVFVTGAETEVRTARRRIIAYYGAEGGEALTLFHDDFSAALEAMERATGFVLPYDTVRVAFAPAGPEGFEAPGIVSAGSIIADPALLADAKARLSVDTVPGIASLAARLWSGGLLSVASWSDAWVTEAVAGWLVTDFVGTRSGEGFAADLRAGRADAYFREAAEYRRPLVWDRWEHPSDLLDSHSVARGAGFLHMLDGLLGDGPFRAGIRRLFSRHANGDVDTEDLKEALEGASGRDLGPLFDAWVYGAGHPELDLTARFDLATDRLDVEVAQRQRGTLVPTAFPLESDVRWMTLAGEGSAPVVTDEPVWTFATEIGIEPRFVVLDADDRMTADIRSTVDLTSLTALARYGSLPARIRATRAMADFADDPALPLAIRLALDQERDPIVRRALADLSTRIPAGGSLESLIRRVWSDPDPGVRLAAVRAARMFAGDPTWESFVRDEATRDSSSAILAAAVLTLAEMRSADAGYIARSAIITPSHGERVRTAGFRVLATDSTMTEFERRRTILDHTAAGLPVEEIIAALSLAEAHGADRALRERMLSLLDHADFRVRAAAADAAGHVLSSRDSAQIDRRLESERDPGVRLRFQAALDRLGG